MSSFTLKPAVKVSGSVRLPGDKSISHRYAMLAALAAGTTTLRNFSPGADCASTLACLRALGVNIQQQGTTVTVEGLVPALKAPQADLDCGNSGSTMRMLAGILAAQDFSSRLVGDESLSRRPMARVIEPLTRMGAHITAADGDRPPLSIQGYRLRGVDYQIPMASAQVKTCLLFAGLLAEGETTIEEPSATRDHGELALEAFGASIDRGRNRVSIAGGQKLTAIAADIPGDISSAAFFLAAAIILPESSLIVEEVLLNPTRSAFLDVLSGMGARITVVQVEDRAGELRGTLKVEPGRLLGMKISGSRSAALIDELPVLAAIAPYTEEGIEIHDARELRFKESDRIAGVAANLRRMGAECEEFDDGMHIPGKQKLGGAMIHSGGDHRIAMAFAVAALGATGETTIDSADCVGISFPTFFTMLESIVER